MYYGCEICGKEVLENEKTVRVQAGRKSSGLSKLFGYFGAEYSYTVAHADCLELPKSNLKNDKDVSKTEYVRNAMFKLGDVELKEVEEE